MMLLVGGTVKTIRPTVLPRKRVMRGEFNTSNERRTVFFRTTDENLLDTRGRPSNPAARLNYRNTRIYGAI